MELNALRIMFVDDDAAILRSMSRQFSFCLDITTAYSAEEALRLLDGPGSFDVVVVDVTMPGMNGLDLIDIVAEKRPYIKFIVLTGNTDKETFQRAEEMSCVKRVLSKPASSPEILEAIECAAGSSLSLLNPESGQEMGSIFKQ